MRRARLGSLDCVVAGGEGETAVVLLHGYGAGGDDLVPLGEALAGVLPDDVRWIFPAAPLAMADWAGRAWWHLDAARLNAAFATGQPFDRADEHPEGLTEARATLRGMLAAVEAEGVRRLILGGFSQGAMLSTDVALHDERPLAGLILLSGTLLAASDWLPRLPTRKGVPVFQSHGARDPLLSFRAAERLRDEMTKAGLDVTFTRFEGGHEIPMPVLQRLAAWLRERATG